MTESVYQELCGAYKFEERGLIDVKGKGNSLRGYCGKKGVRTEASAGVNA
jgi:hypothetical protein